MDFCPVCGNVLYMREGDGGLARVCRFCDYRAAWNESDPSITKLCVSDVDHRRTDAIGALHAFRSPDVVDDPTIPRVTYIPCPSKSCTRPPSAENDVVFIKYNIKDMLFAYHCVYCHHVWTTATATASSTAASAAVADAEEA